MSWRFTHIYFRTLLMVLALVLGGGLGIPLSIRDGRVRDLLIQVALVLAGLGFFLGPCIAYRWRTARPIGTGAHLAEDPRPQWAKPWKPMSWN